MQPPDGTGEMICNLTQCRSDEDVMREINVYHTDLLRINLNNSQSSTGRGNGKWPERSNQGAEAGDQKDPTKAVEDAAEADKDTRLLVDPYQNGYGTR